jgi:transposase
MSAYMASPVGRREDGHQRVAFGEDAELLVAHVRPTSRARSRCGICRRPRPALGPDTTRAGSAAVAALDLGRVRAVLEADAPRVSCSQHGVVVAGVSWARHDAGHTYAFDQTVAWLATQSSQHTVTQLMRIAWRTVGSIITWVWADVDANFDRLGGLPRIGIDEISYKKNHKYLMVVVDHEHTPAGLGRAGTQQRYRAGALRPARTAAVRCDHPCQRRWSRLHRHHRRADLPRRDPGGGPLHVMKWASEALDGVVGEPGTTPARWPGPSRNAAGAGHRRTHHLGRAAGTRRG